MKLLPPHSCKQVPLVYKSKPGRKVFVAGSFNQWDPQDIRLRDNPDSGIYRATLELPPGRYEYKFVVDGEWHADAACTDWVLNDTGSLNSVIFV